MRRHRAGLSGCPRPRRTTRLAEEINRAERHGTALSCLLVVIENLEEMAREHGAELREQTLAYIAERARRELRASTASDAQATASF